MSQYKMEIYIKSTGIEMTISWASKDDYLMGRQFLTEMDMACGQPREPSATNPEFFYLLNEQQLDALSEFRKKLKNK